MPRVFDIRSWASVAFVLLASACGGETDPADASSAGATSSTATGGEGGGGTTDGSELPAPDYFSQKVFPELSITCGACHRSEANCVPKFMEEEPGPTYEKLKAFGGLVVPPDSSNLRLHGPHTGPALTATQDATMVTWLKKEFPNDTGENSQLDALRALGDCMDEGDYEETQFNIFAYQQTDSGPCSSCHRTGEAGTWLSINADEMYDKTRKLPYIKRLFKPKFDGTTFAGFEASTRLFDKPELAAQCNERHPQASIDAPRRVAAEAYIDASLENYESGNCGP